MESDDKFFSLQLSKKEESSESKLGPLRKFNYLHYFLASLCLGIAGCVWAMVIYAFAT